MLLPYYGTQSVLKSDSESCEDDADDVGVSF